MVMQQIKAIKCFEERHCSCAKGPHHVQEVAAVKKLDTRGIVI